MTGLLGALAVPSIAAAADDDVTVALHEDEMGVTLQIRGVAENSHEQVVTSKTGALLFVRGNDATAQRLHPMGKHRLRFVQIGRAGQRVAVRVVQRKAARGSLSKHMEMVEVPGGFDVRIDDGKAPAVVPEPIAVAQPSTPLPGFDRDGALAKLAGPPVVAARPAVKPIAVTPAAVEPAEEIEAAPAPRANATEDAKAAPAVKASATIEPVVAPSEDDGGARWAAAATQEAPLDLKASAPRIGMAWLATAMLAFSGLGFMWWRRRRPLITTPDALRVVAKVSIGPKQQILWLSAGGRTLLVGATEHRIELLCELDQPNAAVAASASVVPNVAAAAPSTNNDGQRVAAFKQRLRAALGDELAGRNVEPDTGLPPHLEMLAGEPRWARKDAA
ncbi:MAG TPA: flagellar biosynthetic protein FliO [Nannocystaceae bacterium]|nr:flagellar biosynthetic protein FliO [Nannocystaceae bacterium]